MNQIKKWYTYQKERFPVLVYGLYVFCIVFATFCFFNYYGEMYYYEWMNNFSDVAYTDLMRKTARISNTMDKIDSYVYCNIFAISNGKNCR